MAGPTVTLTFAGDSANLEKTFDRVGESAQSMSSEVGRASNRMADSSSALDRFGEAADETDTRAMGFRDTITGLSDAMAYFNDDSLTTEERLLTLGFAVGDLASGIYNFIIPSIKALSGWLRIGLGGAMTFIQKHPLALALTALAGVFVLLWTNSETFRDIVTGVFNAVWSVVKSVAGWIVGRWKWAVGVMSSAARSLGRFFSGIWDSLKSGAKTALNFVIDILNRAIGALNTLINGINYIPGVSIPHIPTIPRFHQGGKVPGAPGTEMLAILQAGETVIPANRSTDSGGVAFRFVGNTDTAVATLIMRLIRSGEIQIEAV